MIEKAIPYIGILMVKNNPGEYPEYRLPAGYSFVHYKKGYESYWAKLHLILDQFDTTEEAQNYYRNEFLVSIDNLYKKGIFVQEDTGNIIATASLWEGEHFGAKYQRLHWVAVHPDHQGKGIAKALITKTLEIFNKLGYQDFIYLTSQTESYQAINIYLQFGFEPYTGSKPENWSGTNEDFARDNQLAWKLILDRIKDYREQ